MWVRTAIREGRSFSSRAACQRVGDRVDVVALFDPLDVPAERGEPSQAVFGKGEFGTAFDRDVIVGIEDDELAQSQMAGFRACLGRDPFLQVAVTGQDVSVVVHDRMTRSIETRREGRLGDGHADGIGQALPQGTGGGLDAGSLAVFRMTRRPASPLAEPLEFLKGQVKTRDMKQSVQAAHIHVRPRGRSGPGRARGDRVG